MSDAPQEFQPVRRTQHLHQRKRGLGAEAFNDRQVLRFLVQCPQFSPWKILELWAKDFGLPNQIAVMHFTQEPIRHSRFLRSRNAGAQRCLGHSNYKFHWEH